MERASLRRDHPILPVEAGSGAQPLLRSPPPWTPYAFAAQGGTPLLADSQSAPLYPPNLLFLLFFRLPRLFWYAFGLSATLHLLIAAAGTYRFLRALSLCRVAALLGAVTFCLSAPTITWLALPTFLAVSCWIPGYCYWSGMPTNQQERYRADTPCSGGHSRRHHAARRPSPDRVLWPARRWSVCALPRGPRRACRPCPARHVGSDGDRRRHTRRMPGAAAGSSAVELSRVSHRAASTPTRVTYAAYITNAFPLRNLVTLLVPDYFGHPNRDGGFYWNTNNYAEWAVYVGVAPLALAVFALVLPWRGSRRADCHGSALFSPSCSCSRHLWRWGPL